MLMYGWMVFVEHAPERYDWAVKLMTGGRIDKIKDTIAGQVKPGMKVLDIGCGTGTLAVRCLEKGAIVTGLDMSEFMLKEARRRADEAGYSKQFTTVKDSVTQIHKHFEDESFDMIVSTMALGEFPRDYLKYVMEDCRRILKKDGRLMIADEVQPTGLLSRAVYGLSMVLLWIPQFLLLRRVFFPIRQLGEIIESGGFKVNDVKEWPLSTFKLYSAGKANVV